ncbi:efflux RND transporter permease subunit [Thiorhodococcus minor]|uniref:Efflux RND transporter permease subunit n=1 Tax=Thiorhodococcus minor TaxID=57489 RepID=A0A6M0K316_9GAMM|nr:efflux RND transporter permease subunit [Thiorhodococcus minor]NEV64172.1 efflux RND transporter permease subunit [Thiorhodococcus minor]
MSAERVERLIIRPFEDAARRVPEIAEIRSVSMPGTSIIHTEVYPSLFELDQIWDKLRQKVAAARADLPAGTPAPRICTDFGDVTVVTVVLLAEDSPWQERLDIAEYVRGRLYAVPGTKRVDLLGVQSERIFIEIRDASLAEMLRRQNTFHPGGIVDTGARGMLVDPRGQFNDAEEVGEALVTLPGGHGVIALRDIAEVRRAPVDPPERPAYCNGRPVIVFAVSMRSGSSVLDYGHAVDETLEQIEASLPIGYRLEIMTFQADQVAKAVYGVTANVLQTLAIVLLVVILFLGVRTGLLVGAIVPAVMGLFELALQRMSLATLAIALGLLVVDGIVVAEDFERRLEEGTSRDAALRRGRPGPRVGTLQSRARSPGGSLRGTRKVGKRGKGAYVALLRSKLCRAFGQVCSSFQYLVNS